MKPHKNFFGNFKPIVDGLLTKTHPDAYGKVVIAGGFLRDLYLKRKPKDIDIFFSGPRSSKAMFESLRDNNPKLFEGCEMKFYEQENYGGEGEDVKGNFAVYDLCKVKLACGLNVDIIATSRVWEEPWDLLAGHFDCSLNAVAYDGERLYTPNGVPHRDGTFYPLGGAFIDNQVTPERMARLVEKVPMGNFDAFKQFFTNEDWTKINKIKAEAVVKEVQPALQNAVVAADIAAQMVEDEAPLEF